MKGGVRLTAGGSEGVRDCVSLRIWSKNKTSGFEEDLQPVHFHTRGF